MDFESNCGDADDELQMFENTPETKSATATNVSVGCGTSTNDRTKSVGASGKRISSDVGKEVVVKKVRGNTCHASNPGPTRLADPNRFPGRETQDWDSLPDFFFF